MKNLGGNPDISCISKQLGGSSDILKQLGGNSAISRLIDNESEEEQFDSDLDELA